MITVIDYGMGNSGSIINMLRKIGEEGRLSADLKEIASAEKLILPGVGPFDTGMAQLESRGMIPVLNEQVKRGTPLLGICLGAQLLGQSSEEGQRQGLGWINARSIRFRFDPPRPELKVPHIGWNTVKVRQRHALFEDVDEETRYYFVHSYHIVCADAKDALASTPHGFEFTSAIGRDNVMGTQFHPEKSLAWGMNVLRRFARDV